MRLRAWHVDMGEADAVICQHFGARPDQFQCVRANLVCHGWQNGVIVFESLAKFARFKSDVALIDDYIKPFSQLRFNGNGPTTRN